MATGKTIESIWSGDVLTWYLPTNYKDAPYPPIGALKAWAVDAGLRDGDKIVLHHVASVGHVLSRPDGIKDRTIGIRRTTKTTSMSGYMVVNAPEQAQLPGDVPPVPPTIEWLLRRGTGRNDVVDSASDDKISAPPLPDLQAGVMTVDQAKAVIGEVSPETTLNEMVEATDHKGCEIHIQLTPTKVASQDVIEEPAMEPALSAIDMIVRGKGEVSVTDVANYLRITVEQAGQLIDEGALVGRHIGDVGWVDAASIAKFVQCSSLHDLAKAKEDADDVAAIEARRDEPTIPLTSTINDADVPDMAMFAALDNANERLHGDVARMNVELSTLRQCLGRLQGVIEAKTGVDMSEHMSDPIALTKALIAALMPNRKPYMTDLKSNADTSHVGMTPQPEVRHCVVIGDDTIRATSRVTEGNELIALANAIDDDLVGRAKVAGDDLKGLLQELETPRDRTPSATLQPETNYFYDDVGKYRREPG